MRLAITFGVVGLCAMVTALISYPANSVLHNYTDNFQVIGHVLLLLACADWIEYRNSKNKKSNSNAQ